MPAVETALSMSEAKESLKKLSEMMPNSVEPVHQFGAHLASYLNPELVPMGFVMACELAIYDLQTGINGFTGEPVRSRLVGLPPIVYALLRMEIVPIAEAIFPADFAAGVKAFVDQVNADMKAKQGA